MFFKQKKQSKEPLMAAQACQIATNRKDEMIEKEISDCLNKIEFEATNYGRYYADLSLYCSRKETIEYLKSLGYEIKPNKIDNGPVAYWRPKEENLKDENS